MIQLIDGLPSNIVAAEAKGRVTAEDYETVLIPALDAAVQGNEKVRVLYVLGADFEGYDAEAALDDARMGMRHWASFDRIGLVSDSGSYRTLTKAFGFMMPGHVRVFFNHEPDEAKAWVSSQ